MSPTELAYLRILFGLALLLALPGPLLAAPLDLRQPGPPPGGGPAPLRAAPLPPQPDESSRLASQETRILRLEEELRILTGRIEELEYRQRQLEERLNALQAAGAGAQPAPSPPSSAAAAVGESGAASAGPGAPAGRLALTTPLEGVATTTAGTAAGEARPPASIEPDAAARRGYVLGTIPAEVLRGERAGEKPPASGAAGSVAGSAPQLQAALQGNADERYRAALALLEAGEFALAEQALTRFLDDFPNDPRAPTAAFWLGETYFFRQDYATAAATYARNYRKYGSNAPRAADTLLKLGMSLAALGEREQACRTFEELARRHPDAPSPVRQMLARERTAAGCS